MGSAAKPNPWVLFLMQINNAPPTGTLVCQRIGVMVSLLLLAAILTLWLLARNPTTRQWLEKRQLNGMAESLTPHAHAHRASQLSQIITNPHPLCARPLRSLGRLTCSEDNCNTCSNSNATPLSCKVGATTQLEKSCGVTAVTADGYGCEDENYSCFTINYNGDW